MKLRSYEYVFIGLLAAYLLLIAVTPIDSDTVSKYQLSETRLRAIVISISIIVSAIWAMAMYGSMKFKRYAQSVRRTKEGRGFELIANGLVALSLSLPATGIMNNALDRLSDKDPSLLPFAAIVGNYLPIAIQIIVFYLIARGASKLLASVKSKKPSLNATATAIFVISASSIFSWFVLARPFGGTVAENYYLPPWVVLLTVVIPLQIAWYFGMSAAYQLIAYRRVVRGLVYRSMLTNLVAGIVTVVAIGIIVQVIASLATGLSRLDFTPVLMIVYALLIIYAVGFGLIARGARVLKKIEEV